MNVKNKLCALALLAIFSGISSSLPAVAATSGVPARVAVAVFNGPQEISLESDLGYKVKSGEFSQYKDDFDNLGRALQKSIVTELKDRIGDRTVVSLPAHLADSDSSLPDADYIVEGKIDKIRFEGNTLIPNYYELTLSAKMVSAKTGEVVWRLNHKMFAHMYCTRSEGAAAVFNERMAPHVASKVADSILLASE